MGSGKAMMESATEEPTAFLSYLVNKISKVFLMKPQQGSGPRNYFIWAVVTPCCQTGLTTQLWPLGSFLLALIPLGTGSVHLMLSILASALSLLQIYRSVCDLWWLQTYFNCIVFMHNIPYSPNDISAQFLWCNEIFQSPVGRQGEEASAELKTDFGPQVLTYHTLHTFFIQQAFQPLFVFQKIVFNVVSQLSVHFMRSELLRT